MAKRYGRNQKRKAREEIAALKQETNVLLRWVKEGGEEVNRANKVLDLVYSIAPNSVIFDAKNIHESNWLADTTYHEPMVASFADMSGPQKTFVMRTVDLFDLETTMIDNHFGDYIHFTTTVKGRNGVEVGSHYRLSWQELQIESFEVLRSRISEALTRHLQQGIQNVRR